MRSRPVLWTAIGAVGGIPMAVALRELDGGAAPGAWLVALVFYSLYLATLVITDLPLVVPGALGLGCVGCWSRSMRPTARSRRAVRSAATTQEVSS